MLRIAKVEDTEIVQRMAISFHRESPYRDMPVKHDKVTETIHHILSSKPTEAICILGSCGPQTVGMIVGMVTEIAFSGARLATEVTWYVEPKFRQGTIGGRLFRAYEYWAHDIAKVDMIQMTTIGNSQEKRIGDFLLNRNYRLTEQSYLKELTKT